MKTEIKLLKQIYLKPGMHVRALARALNLGIPSVKYALNKLIKEKVVRSRQEGRNLKFFINYKSTKIVPYLSQVEYSRFAELPKDIQDSIKDMLAILDNKPLLTLIFGSYANKKYNKESDVDVLLVFNETKEDIEEKTNIINNRYNVKIEPVYMSWQEFSNMFFDARNRFFHEIKQNKLLITGIWWWVMLEKKTRFKILAKEIEAQFRKNNVTKKDIEEAIEWARKE